MERRRPEAPSPRSGQGSGAAGGKEGQAAAKLPPSRMWWLFLGALLVNFLVLRWFDPRPDAITVPYTTFKEQVAKHNVASIYSQGESIEGRFKEPVDWPPPAGEKKPDEKKRDE